MAFNAVQFSSVQCSAVQCSPSHCSVIQCSELNFINIIDIMNTKLLHNQAENIIFYEGDTDIHSDGVVQCSSVQWCPV